MSRREFLHGYTVGQLSLMMQARQDAQEQAEAEHGEKKGKSVPKEVGEGSRGEGSRREFGSQNLPGYVQDALRRYEANPDSLPNVSFLSGGLRRSEI